MTATIIAFFSSMAGVGSTSLVYHLSWMYANLGLKVLASDFDPQASLTASFLDEEQLEGLWADEGDRRTIYARIKPMLSGEGEVASGPFVERIDDRIHLIPGDPAISLFEDEFSRQWQLCLQGEERAFLVESALWSAISTAADKCEVDLALIDLGPNLGALNRSALLAADFLVAPLAPGLFSLQGLRTSGPCLREWRVEWQQRLTKNKSRALKLAKGKMLPMGYVAMQKPERIGLPVGPYKRWVEQIPPVYAEQIAGEKAVPWKNGKDENQLGLIKHYRSLIPMAQEARKPIFHLKAADGAIGSHQKVVSEARDNFAQLAGEIARRCNIILPE
ncbi:MAG TPA: ParA family protein [Methanothrix sp.]|nr:ParA family protein [Methanothrix sp.]HPT19044.1 ParA family protein [Methanothrix sp.]